MPRKPTKATKKRTGRYHRVPRNVSGHGDYRLRKDFFSAPKLGGMLGGAFGSTLGGWVAPGIGSAVGGEIGQSIGKQAGRLFKSVTGWGDYTVNHNTLLYPEQDVVSFGDDSIRVKHREYIMDIGASHDFTNVSLPLNPGLDTTFPWLTAIARNYEQYRFNGMIFQFVSTSSDAIANLTDLGLGTVCMATDYNSADADFVNMPQALNSMFANSAKPSENILHAIECAPSEQANKLYYVRTGQTPPNTDIRLYDLAKFQISTQGMPVAASYTAGQLWVSYDVTFCKSISNNQVGFALNTDKWLLSTISLTNTFGNSQQLADYSCIGTTLGKYPGASPNDTIYFPPSLSSGYYLINYSAYASPGTNGSITIDNLVNCSAVYAYVNNSSTSANSGSSTGSTVMLFNCLIRINDRNAYFRLVGSNLLAASAGDLIITQVNGEIYLENSVDNGE